MEAATEKKKIGRPKKALPDTSTKMSFAIAKTEKDYIERTATMLNMPVGKLVRIAVATHAGLVPIVTQQHKDMVKMREMMEDIQKQLRVIARFTGKAAQSQGDEQDESSSAVDGFTRPDFSFADGE